MTEPKENWSWGKFFSGFFDGKNYAKAIVMMFCMVVIISIGFALYSTIMRYVKPKAQPIPQVQTIGTNSGTVVTDNKQEEKKAWQLFGGLVQINT
jgi:ABC-type lipoprotein release transport system permease subunit